MVGIHPFDPNAIDSMRSGGYAFKDSLCELIDNSIWHGQAKNIQINLSWLDKSRSTDLMRFKEVFVADNGVGMTTDGLKIAVQIGNSTTYGSSDNFGRFGYGLIAGAITQCRMVEIYSKTKNGDWNYIQYDVNQIKEGKLIPEPVQKNPPDNYTSIIENQGTIIVWSQFDIAESFDNDWDAYRQGGGRKGDLGYLNYELGRIYRKFIAEEIADVEIKNLPESERAIVDAETRPTTVVVKNQDVRVITLNGKKIIPVDPLYLTKIPGFENDPEPHTVYNELIFDVKTHPIDRERTGKDSADVNVRMTVLNEQWRQQDASGTTMGAEDHWPRYIHWNKGISVLRNGREIFFGHITGIGPREEHLDRYWGCEIDFPATLDRLFTVKNVKIGINPDTVLRDVLNETVGNAIRDARRVIEAEFKQTKAAAKKVADEGPHGPAEGRFEQTGTGHDVAVEVTEEEKQRAKAQLEARFKDFDVDKFAEIAIKFEDDPGMSPEGPFLEVKNELGNNIVIYNTSHPFFIHLGDVYSKIEELGNEVLANDPEEKATAFRKAVLQTRYLIDLLLGSYAAAKGKENPDAKQLVGSTLMTIMSNWTTSLFTVSNDKQFDKRVDDEV